MPDAPAAALPSTPVLALAGPTASGKTAVAIALARASAVPVEILSADSRQVYRGLHIGSAAPTAAERAAVPHHLLDLADPDDVMSAGRYARAAWAVEATVRARGAVPLYVGGAGMYLDAVRGALAADLPADPAVRAALVAEAEARGNAALHADLARIDPASAARLAPRDRVRVVRALEIYRLTGEAPSAVRARARAAQPVRALHVVYLERAPEDLDARVRARTAAMLRDGLREECAAVLARWPEADALLRKTVGYAALLDPALAAAGDAAVAEAIARATRQYARRQRIWFAARPEVERLPLAVGEEPAKTARQVAARLGIALG